MKRYKTRLWKECYRILLPNASFKITMWRYNNPIARWRWNRRLKKMEKQRIKVQKALDDLMTMNVEFFTGDLI